MYMLQNELQQSIFTIFPPIHAQEPPKLEDFWKELFYGCKSSADYVDI